MTTDPTTPTRRRRPRAWVVVLLIITVILAVPDLRHAVGMFLAYAVAVLAAIVITVFVLCSGSKPNPPRRR